MTAQLTIKCIGVRYIVLLINLDRDTAENLDKWIPVVVIGCYTSLLF